MNHKQAMAMTHAPTETDIQRAVLAQLRVCRIPAWRNNSRVFRVEDRLIRASVKGASDLVGLLPPSGRFLAIEIKRPGAALTPAQSLFLDAIAQAGGLPLVVSSAAELMVELARAGWKHA